MTINLDQVINPLPDDEPADGPVDEPEEETVDEPVPEPEIETEEAGEPPVEEPLLDAALERVRLTSSSVSRAGLDASQTSSERPVRGVEVESRDRDRRAAAGSSQEVFRLTVLREQAMWEALDLLGNEISNDAERKQAKAEQVRSRIESVALALSTGMLAVIARASSLTTMALSDRERKKREKELLEDETVGLGELLTSEAEPDPDDLEDDPDDDEKEYH